MLQKSLFLVESQLLVVAVKLDERAASVEGVVPGLDEVRLRCFLSIIRVAAKVAIRCGVGGLRTFSEALLVSILDFFIHSLV